MGIEGNMYLRFANVFFAGVVHYEHVGGLEELFLYAAGRDVDFVFMADAGATTRTCNLENYSC